MKIRTFSIPAQSVVSVVEVTTGTSRIVIDMGWGTLRPDCLPLPDIAGLFNGDEREAPDALVVAHPYLDAVPLWRSVRAEVPIFANHRVLRAVNEKRRAERRAFPREAEPLVDGQSRYWGDIGLLPIRFPRNEVGSLAVVVRNGEVTGLLVGDTTTGGLSDDEIATLTRIISQPARIYVRESPWMDSNGLTLEVFERELGKRLAETTGLVLVVGSRGNRALVNAMARAADLSGRRLVVEPRTVDLHPHLWSIPGLGLAWGNRIGMTAVEPAMMAEEPGALVFLPWLGAWHALELNEPAVKPRFVINTHGSPFANRRDLFDYLRHAEASGAVVEHWPLQYGNGLRETLADRYPNIKIHSVAG